jgi:plasmid stabilization system protein ParE
MSITINRRYRDAIYDGLMTDLTAIGDIFTHLHNDEPANAQRLHRRFAAELRLLDDLGWGQEPDATEFELTMPARELRSVIERVYWSAVASLNNHSDELIDEAISHLSDATVACPEILARLADDLMSLETHPNTDVADVEEA